MSAAKLFSQLNSYYYQNYESRGLCDPNWIISEDAITWPNRLSMPALEAYDELYQWKIDNNQASLKMDEGIFQLYYKFTEGILTGASVSFMSSPLLCEDYIRIDFDPDSNEGFYHHSCHIHPTVNGKIIRIPVANMQSPVAFIEFVTAMIKKHPLSRFDKSHSWDTDITSIAGYMIFEKKI